MSTACPTKQTKQSQEWIDLVEEVGETTALAIFNEAGNRIPKGEDLRAFIRRENSKEVKEDNLSYKEDIRDIIEKLNNPNVEKLPDQRGYVNTKTGNKINKRVSMLVDEYYRQHGYHFEGDGNKFYALKGTVIHEYMNYLLTNLTKNNQVSLKEAYNFVEQLKDLDEFSDVDSDFFDLNAKQFNLLKQLASDLISDIKDVQKSIDPEGEVSFFTEISIMDEYRDVAGTIDFLAVFSDGSASMYDFKTFGSKNEESPSTLKIGAWDVQLSNYRNMLKENYGINQFRHVRAIPIETGFDKWTSDGWINQYEKGFQSLAAKTRSNSLDYLNPIPVQERTGDENFDKLLDNLQNEISNLDGLIAAEYNKDKQIKLKQRKKRLLNSMNSLELNKDVSDLLTVLYKTAEVFRNRLHKGKSEEGYLDRGDLVQMIDEIKIYDNLTINFKNQIKNYPKKERAEIAGKIDAAESQMRELIDDTKKELLDRLPKDIKDSGHIPANDLSKMLYGIANWDMPIFRELRQAWRNVDNMVLKQTMKDIDEIQEYDQAFREWASQNGYSQKEKFSLLINKNKNLHSKYNDEFFNKKKELQKKAYNNELTKEDKKWLSEHFSLNKERFKEEVVEAFVSSVTDQYETGYITKKEHDERIEKFNKHSNPLENPQNFYKGNYFEYFTPKDNLTQYINPDWEFIQKHKPLKDYYDMYQRFNRRFAETVGKSVINENFVANVQQNITDHILEYGQKNFREVFFKKFELRKNDEFGGSTDAEGKSLPTIPLMHVDRLRHKLSDKKKAQIERDVEALYNRGTQEFENEVAKRIKDKEYEIGMDAKSTDLTKSLMLFSKSVHEYQHLSEIEPMIKGIKYLVDTGEIETKSMDETGKTVLNRLTGSLVKKIGLDPTVQKAFETFTNRLIYKQKFEQELFATEKYSSNKIISSLMQWLSIRALGFNAVISASNFIQGKSGLWMAAKEGRYFDKVELKDTVNAFTGHDEQFLNVVEHFIPATRDMIRERIELSGATGASRRLRSRTFFLGHIKGDDHVDNTLTVAMAKRYRVDSDGKIKNPRSEELLDENAPTVYESVKVDEDGKTFIPGLSNEEFGNFRAKIQKQAYKIKGMMSEEHKGIYASNMLWTMFMQFRTWTVGLAENRFGELKYDATMEELEIGRFNAALGGLFKGGAVPAFKEAMGLITEISLMGLYKRTPNAERIQYKFDKFIRENKQYKGKITKEQFVQLQKDKLNGFLAEARVYLGMIVATQLLKGLDWDDEEESNLFTYNSFKITQRALLEVSFWFNPRSVDEIVKSPLPLWGLFNESINIIDSSVREVTFAIEGEKPDRIKTSPAYYLLKSTPGVNQVLDFAKFFDEYNPPKTSSDYIFDWMFEDEDN